MASESDRTASGLSVANLTIASSCETSDAESDKPQPVPRCDLVLPEHNENQIVCEKGKVYTRGMARPAKMRERPPKGWYWKHGEEIHYTAGDEKRWKCEKCWDDNIFAHWAISSNKSINKHLSSKHNTFEFPPTPTLSITPAAPSGNSVLSFFDWERLKLYLIEWIVVMHITFSQVESKWFRRFLGSLSPTLEGWIPRAGNTVKKWILAEFELRRERVKNRLHASKSRIHLSFDLWTSPNNFAIVSVVGHFMGPSYKVETTLLGLRRLRGKHTGENIAEAVISVVKKYGLTSDQIGWFVLDNASSNDTCVAEILKGLDIDDTVEHRRLRCLGHIINLAAKSFLFGADSDIFEKEVDSVQLEEEQVERDLWRRRGPVGKLHNVVKYIRTTPQRREEFEDIVRGELQRQKDRIARTALPDEEAEFVSKEPLAVIQDNETRWNSVFCMIKRAFILKDPLDLFIKRALEKPTKDCPLPRDDELSAQDWNTLAATQDLLQPFFDLTMRLQGHATHGTHGALTEALPALEFLLSQLEAKRDEYSVAKELQHASATSRSGESVKKGGRKGKRPAEPEVPASDDIIPACIDSCWAKLRKYYRYMQQSPVYAAAVVLNPEHKWKFFAKNWEDHPDWIEEAEENVNNFWESMYKNYDDAGIGAQAAGLDTAGGLFRPDRQGEPSEFDKWFSRKRYSRGCTGALIPDEYQGYLETDFLNETPEPSESSSLPRSVDLCAFWEHLGNKYPSLARMAFDLLSIPAMSAECERVFSSTKLLLTDRRSRMKEDIIEASECLRAWVLAEL
jgi:hAT family C-terminal dimerisation region